MLATDAIGFPTDASHGEVDGSMRFGVLGEVVAYNERGQVPLGSARQRTVLAALLVEPGGFVALDQLVDRVWGQTPPQQARQTLHTYLSRLRSVLGDAGGPAPARRSAGYTLEVDASAVDLHRFRHLVAQAGRAADDRAAGLWREAMALWRGRPFANLDSDWLRAVAVGLEAERLAAVLDHTDLLLRRGEHARLLPELTAAAGEHPLDERLAGQLMLALYRCGRQADALAHYRLLHDRLADELGSDPGPPLRELHQRMLRHDPELSPSAAAEPQAPAGTTAVDRAPADPVGHRPAQLPADVAGFTGRTDDLRFLDGLLDHTDAGNPVVITAIGGTAGVGKTALAVHWAHRIADRFPDGQLYLNLRGYDPEQPVPAADALARFLTALGVVGQEVPFELDERAARYRSELAGRRMLIVLDNAADVAQVRPLLPGSGSCLVVVTSRDSLPGLVAVHGAHRLDLDLLPAEDAVDLLRRLIGRRVAAEPEAAAGLAEQCVRLPLALRVAAELAVSRPDRTLTELTAELADRQARLGLLDTGGDAYSAVREVFSWSIQHLPADAARAFRLLGLHPGPDLDPYAMAALADADPQQAHQALEALARAHLVHRTGRGRYGVHDLLRAYAQELAAAADDEQRRRAAAERLSGFYLAAAGAAMDTLHPSEAHHRPKLPPAAAALPDLTDAAKADAWLEAERPCLVAIVAHHATCRGSEFAVSMARVLYRYLSAAHLTEQLALNDHALRAAEQAGDVVGTAHALRHLATAYTSSGRYEQANEHGQQALARFRSAGDRIGAGLTLLALGVTHSRMGRYEQAIDDYRQSTAGFREAHDRLGEAFGLANLGVVTEGLGRHDEAADHNRQALAIFRELGSLYHEGLTLGNLADVEVLQGEYTMAAEHLREALGIVQRLDIPITEASVLDSLGRLHLRLGQPDTATGYLRRAFDLCRATGEKYGQTLTLNGLGQAAQDAGRPTEALAHHTDALALALETSTRHEQARAHAGIGHARHALGDPAAARENYQAAYAIYTELDLPEAAGDLRTRLDSLIQRETGSR